MILPVIQSIELIDPLTHDRGFDGFDLDSFLQLVKVRRPTLRSPDSLRRVVMSYSRRWHESGHHYLKHWELASDTIQSLNDSYGVVADRVFLARYR